MRKLIEGQVFASTAFPKFEFVSVGRNSSISLGKVQSREREVPWNR